MNSGAFGFALLSSIAIVASAPALATGSLTRTFVSSSGVDTNPCTVALPCATFAAAYAAVAVNGIVAALDPGKYGPLNITSPVTINGNRWAAITGQAGSGAITINAGSGDVTLIGLELDGAGVGTQGIYLTSNLSENTSLNIRDCVISHFTDSGITIQPTSSNINDMNILIENTFSLNNGVDGIKVEPAGIAIVKGVITGSTVANNNSNGLEIDGSVIITVATLVATNNNAYGIYANSTETFTLRDTISSLNFRADFYALAGLNYLYHNTISSFINKGASLYSDGTNQLQGTTGNLPTQLSTY